MTRTEAAQLTASFGRALDEERQERQLSAWGRKMVTQALAPHSSPGAVRALVVIRRPLQVRLVLQVLRIIRGYCGQCKIAWRYQQRHQQWHQHPHRKITTRPFFFFTV
jgi:hypothetical protein